MNNDDFDVAKLAELARIDLSDDERTQFTGELERVLKYVKQLGAVPTDGVEETAQVTGLTNVLREDVGEKIVNSKQKIAPTPEGRSPDRSVGKVSSKKLEELKKRREELLAAVAEQERDMIKVPAILDNQTS